MLKHKKKTSYIEGIQTLAYRIGQASIFGDVRNPISHSLELTLVCAGDWTRRSSEVPSKLNDSVIKFGRRHVNLIPGHRKTAVLINLICFKAL